MTVRAQIPVRSAALADGEPCLCNLRPEGVMVVTSFKIPALKQLSDQQVRFAPPARRAEQLGRAEKLLAEIEPQRVYPYPFVCYRITDYRPATFADLLIGGHELAHDLCLFIEALGRKTPAV